VNHEEHEGHEEEQMKGKQTCCGIARCFPLLRICPASVFSHLDLLFVVFFVFFVVQSLDLFPGKSYRNVESCARAEAINCSKRSPIASNCGFVTMFSPRFSKWYSWMFVSTIESTGQLSSQKPQ